MKAKIEIPNPVALKCQAMLSCSPHIEKESGDAEHHETKVHDLHQIANEISCYCSEKGHHDSIFLFSSKSLRDSPEDSCECDYEDQIKIPELETERIRRHEFDHRTSASEDNKWIQKLMAP